MTLTIGVDVGGTKVAGGVVDDTGAVLVQARRDTPADDVGKTRDVIIELVGELAAGRTIESVGIGAAGWIDASRSTVLFAPNLAWRDEPLREYVSEAVGLPVIVENDGNVAAWAEFRYGAARDADDSMVMFTIGTGVGGGIVLGGELVRGAHGIAANWATCWPCRTGTSAAAGGWAASSSTPAAAPWSASPEPVPARSPSGPPLCWSWPVGTPRRSPARW
ncbi:hypothetical protein GCM10027614_27310 [Micromonospora vulcania]